MPITLVNDDFVLGLENASYDARSMVGKYEPFFEALSLDRYAFQREAMRRALLFLASENYTDTSVLATEHFNASDKLRGHFANQPDYLGKFRLADRKAISLDLATGAGKSFVLYGIARTALAMGMVDKVLVLCPSLTIEEGLKDKFRQLSARQDLKQVMESLGAVYPNPPIKSANDPILDGDICVENIHAVYDRTGSSISDSFKGNGARTLVLNDEAHHIYSEADAGTKKWLGFLRSEEYGFRMIVGVSGTPYIGNEYFPDVLFRYGLKQAIEEGVVKKPDYATDRDQAGNVTLTEIFANHEISRRKYGAKAKPVSIVVTEKILACVQVWKQLVDELAASMPRAEAEKKVIWVASGIPSGADGTEVKRLIPDAEKARKQNMQLLRSVDSADNPVEWIVSVSMLTEGWDVPNVFQVVPWETRAFNSKLLIAQVLGRGLRIPAGLERPLLTVANHVRWTTELKQLFDEVLEIENRVSSTPAREAFSFPLFNLTYATEQVTEQTSAKRAKEPDAVAYLPQARQVTQIATYAHTGNRSVLLDVPDTMPVGDAVARIRLFLEDKDEAIATQWPKKRIESFIVDSLKATGNPTDFLSRENLTKTQNAFGPMFRAIGSTVPRQKLRPNDLVEIDPMKLPSQSVSEDQLRGTTTVFYTNDAAMWFAQAEERSLWESWIEDRAIGIRRPTSDFGHLPAAMKPIDASKFKCPTNLLVARYRPEQKFVEHVIEHASLFDAFFKNADAAFYSFPYSFKSSLHASTHAKTENFNPDFFLKLAGRNDVLVVEIKADGDDSSRNRAKLRDAKEHFKQLNAQLAKTGKKWEYHFYFLSETDYGTFFSAISDNRLDFVSSLMLTLQ
jgi:type III restriction enzyme